MDILLQDKHIIKLVAKVTLFNIPIFVFPPFYGNQLKNKAGRLLPGI
jgi:hypothetical protein